MAVLGLHCCGVFPSLVVTVWATLHFGAWLLLLWRTDPRTRGLQQFRLPGLESTGSVVAAHRHLPHWQLDSFITEPPGEPCSLLLDFHLYGHFLGEADLVPTSGYTPVLVLFPEPSCISLLLSCLSSFVMSLSEEYQHFILGQCTCQSSFH